MSEDDGGREGFEEMFRSLAREVSQSVERIANLDLDEIAESLGIDPARARLWADSAGRWLSAQAENLGDDVAFWNTAPGRSATDQGPLRSAGPHPLDLPTAEQGLALGALDSGRWSVEPGSNVLVAHGEGPAPAEAVGLVGELRARDWIAADGELTLVGRNALRRWLAGAEPR